MHEQNTNRALTEAAADEWKVLPSGLTVLVRPMPGYSGTHVIYATRFGSIDRDFRVDGREVHLPAGVAHFLEHKMFEDEDGDAFAKFAKTGANANAFTSFDRTCYLFTATEQLDESLDVLLGMVGRPYFTEQTIAKEQGIIGQEIKMYDDSADWPVRVPVSQPPHPQRHCGHGGKHCRDHAGDAVRLLQGVLCPQQHGAGRRRQHQHGTDPGGLCTPRPDGSAPGGAGAAALDRGTHDAGRCRKDHYNAGVQALLRHRLQGAAAAA